MASRSWKGQGDTLSLSSLKECGPADALTPSGKAYFRLLPETGSNTFMCFLKNLTKQLLNCDNCYCSPSKGYTLLTHCLQQFLLGHLGIAVLGTFGETVSGLGGRSSPGHGHSPGLCTALPALTVSMALLLCVWSGIHLMNPSKLHEF